MSLHKKYIVLFTDIAVDTTLLVTELAAERGGSFEVDEVH